MKEKNYKLLKKLILVLIITVAVATVLTACNGDNGQTSEPSDQKPPIEQSQTTVSKIMADMSAYKNFDLLSEFNNVALDIVDKKVQGEAELLIYTVESHNFVVIAQNENGSFTSVAVPLSQTCENYIKNSSSKESLILAVANLTGSTQIEASGKGTVQQKISTAIQTIVDNVAAIENGETAQLNTYVSDGDKIDLSEVYGNNRSAAYLREDGSVIAFVFDEEKCEITMKHYVVDGAKDMTAAQIVSAIKSGAATTTSINLKFNEDYTLPPLDIQAETITVEEIAKQVFGENYSLESFDELMKELLPTIGASEGSKVLFTGFGGDDFILYSEIIDIYGGVNFGKSQYRGSNLDAIKLYREEVSTKINTKQIVEKTIAKLGIDAEIEKGSEELSAIISALNTYKSNLENARDVIKSSQKADFKTTNIQTATNDISNYTDYAQKLFPGKEIVAAYVGDMGTNVLTPGMFDGTSYVSSFEIAIAYKEAEDITVHHGRYFIPYFNNSTKDSLYNWLLEGGEYKIENETNIVVSNPIIVKSKEA